VRNAIGRPISGERPLIWNDDEQFLEPCVVAVLDNVKIRGSIIASLADLSKRIRGHH
jgi:hypothetical protein